MMKNVQEEKIRQTLELIFKYYQEKNQFMKQNIPIQEELIKKLEETADLSINTIYKLQIALKEEKQMIAGQYEIYEKATLHNRQQFRYENPNKNEKSTLNLMDWNRNIIKVLQSLSVSHLARQNALKIYYKFIDTSYQAIATQVMKYRVDIKHFFKEINTVFQQIDANEKQENKILTKLSKQLKGKQFKQSIYYLTQVKKAESYLHKEIQCFVERNKKILELLRLIFKNEKNISKRIKEILTNLLEKKKDIVKQTPEDQTLLGILAVLQEGVQQSRQQFLQRTLVSKNMQQRISWVIKPQNTKLQHVIKYLSITVQQFLKRYDFFTKIRELGAGISFKNFSGVSLAKGWIITSYTPCITYLTFDHYLVIFDMEGTLLKKIHSSNTVINKSEGNVVYLEQSKKGIFTTSKQQYQLKFDNTDRMEEFILFIENQIS